MIGERISRYLIQKKLGEGGMGEVYLAHDARLSRRVALKFLSPRFANDPKFRNRFRKEARAAAAVDHPYVCKIYEVEAFQDKTFLVLEFVEGQTLQTRLLSGRLPLDDVLRLACEIAEALTEAHRKEVIHRDIKPANIMLTRHDHVKVMDFGLAKHHFIPEDQTTQIADMTPASNFMGTPRYIAPEQLNGETDGRSDIFSFGIVLFEMAAGIHPFERETIQGTVTAILHDRHPSLKRVAPGSPDALERILDRMLEKSPQSRASSMQAVWSELVQLRRGFVPTDATARRELTVAVLPFRDLSPEKNQEYFCDGLVEELINSLTHVEGLRVLSRTSVFRFKGQELDIREIASQLGATTLLEGSVRKAGDRIRITVNLISAETGSSLCSEEYETVFEKIFDIQDNITRTVTQKLRATVTPAEQLRPSRPPVRIEVYDQYLRGLHCWNKRTADGLKQGIRHFEKAIAADPGYVPALEGLANSYVTLDLYGVVNPNEAIHPAKELVERIIGFGRDSAAALTARGCIRAIYDWDWKGAEYDFAAAIAADPRYALARHWYSNNLLIPLGRFDEARQQIQLAEKSDEQSPPIAMAAGLVSLFERRYLRAIDEFRRALALDPGFAMVHYFLGQALIHAKEYPEGIESLELAATLTGGSSEVLSTLGYAHALSGNLREAERCLTTLLERAQAEYVSPVLLAQISAGTGQTEAALSQLEQALKLRSADLIWLNVRPTFDLLRKEGRFQQICSDLGLI